jgi:gliding motility-associated-like protein
MKKAAINIKFMNIPKFLRLCLLLFGLLALEQKALASHLFGGEIKYKFLGYDSNTAKYKYKVTYYVYYNCSGASGIAPQNPSISVRFYSKTAAAGPGTIILDGSNQNWSFPKDFTNTPTITPKLPPGCTGSVGQCVQLLTYEREVGLPASVHGYYTVFDLGNRIAGIDNLATSDAETLTLYAEIPPAFKVNSSPVFTDTAAAIMCAGDTATIINNATDPDGDKLIYSFTSSGSTRTTGQLGTSFTPPPGSVIYKAGFSVAQPFGAGGYAFLNATTGLTKYFIPNPGEYVVTFLVKEYRTVNGVEQLIGTSLRDVQLFVSSQCGGNSSPKIKIPASSYTVKAGATKTFKVRGSDVDSLTQPLTFSGEIFAPNGSSFATIPKITQSGQGIVSTINFNAPCSQPGVYTINLKLKDQACPISKSDSKTILVTVPPFIGPAINGDSIVCNTGRNKYFVTRGSGSDVTAVNWKISSGAGTIFAGKTTDTVYVQWSGVGSGSLRSKYTSTFGCLDSTFRTVTISPGLTPSFTGLAANYCLSDGSVTLVPNISGGTFSGSGISASGVFTPSAATVGTHTITYTVTNNACKSTATASVTVSAAPTPDFGNLTQSSYCKGAAPISAPANSSFSINGGAPTQTFDPTTLAVGNYTVVVKTTSGSCSASASKAVSIFAVPGPSLAFLPNTFCKNDAAVGLPAGTNITYKVDNGTAFPSGSFNPAGLSVGSHTVEITENNGGCIGVTSKTVTVNATPTPSLAFLNSSYCKDASTVSFPAAATGSSVEYKINGTVATSFDPQTLALGTYTVSALETVTATGCNVTTSKTVTVNALPTPSLAVLATSYCKNDAAVTLPGAVTGNTIKYKIDGVSATTFNPQTLNAGSHTISVTDSVNATGCKATTSKSVTINAVPTPTLAFLNNSYCKDAAAISFPAAVTGNTIEYKVNGTVATSLNPQTLAPGTYTVSAVETITATSCNATVSKTVIVNALPTPTLAFLNTSYCKDAATIAFPAVASGNTIEYKVNGVLATSLNPQTLAAGTYTISAVETITATGCNASATKTVTINAIPTASLAILANSYCKDAAPINFPAAVAGNTIEYKVNGVVATSFNPQTLAPGTYTVLANETITATSCSASASKTVTINALPTPSLATLASSFCKNDASVHLLPNNTSGTTTIYSVDGVRVPIATGLFIDPAIAQPGTYTITATDSIRATGCKASVSKTITINPVPTPTLAFLNNAYCKDAATITFPAAVTGNSIEYKVNGTIASSFNPQTLAAGTYTISAVETITSTSCNATVSKTVTVNPLPTPTLAFLNNAYCKDAVAVTFPAAVAGNTTKFKIDGVAATAFAPQTLSLGVHTVVVLDSINATGCKASATKTITINSVPTVNLAVLANSYCKDAAAITLPGTVAGNTIKYKVDGIPVTSFNPQSLTAGPHTVSVVDSVNATSCKASTTKIVYIFPLPTPSLAFLNNAYCKDVATITFPAAVTGNTIEYKVNGTVATSFNPQTLAVGTYTISALETITATGCNATTFKTVTINALPTPTLAFLNASYCHDAAAIALPAGTGGNVITYQIDGNAVTTGTFNPATLAVGTRTITALETIPGTGCNATVSKTITIDPTPLADAVSGPLSVCPGITGIPYKIVNPRETVYEWTISAGTGTIVSGQNTDKIIVNWGSTSTTATLTARAKNGAGCFGPTTSYNVTINPILITPQPVGNLSVCLKQGDSVRYVMPNPTPGSSFAWSINGGTMVGMNNTTVKDTVYIKWSAPGTGTISVQESSTGTVSCFGNSTPLTVTILASPDATLPINGPISVCEGTQNVAYTLNGGQNSTYAWTMTRNGNTTALGSTLNTVSFNFGTPGQYLFTAIETNAAACVGSPITKVVTVTPKPLTDSIYGPANICPENLANHWYSVKGPAGATYSWQVTGGTFTPTNNDSIQVTFDNGTVKQITVTPTSAAGCIGASYTRKIVFDPSELVLEAISTGDQDDNVMVLKFKMNKITANKNPIDIYRREITTSTFVKVQSVPNSSFTFTDTGVNTHEKIYEYRLESKNECGTKLESSKHTAILLATAITNETEKSVKLSWNTYKGWGKNGVKEYEVYGKADNSTYQYLTTINATDSVATLPDIAKKGFNQCFRIKAIGIAGQLSWSNSTCTSFENKLVIYNIITPNGDQYNEAFIIENVALYPDNELMIFNRWGNQVYSKKNYNNEWKGEGLESGTYYYLFKLKNGQTYKGWVEIAK